MQLFSDCREDFTPLAGILGLYFQIRDDYCNLCLQEVIVIFNVLEFFLIFIAIVSLIAGFFQYSENKSYCEDLSEGKFSFPIIHAIQSNADDGQVLSIL